MLLLFRYEDRRILLQKAVAWHLQQEDFRRELTKELSMRGRWACLCALTMLLLTTRNIQAQMILQITSVFVGPRRSS